MRYLHLNEKYKNPIVLALGFFDCIHRGHRLLVDTACEYGKIHGAESALLTFSNDPSEFLGREKQIYALEDRAYVLKNLGLENIITAKFDSDFASLDKERFLDILTGNFNVKAIITGSDYTFGNRAEGDVNYLINYCAKKNIVVITVPFETYDGRKISTSDMKNLVKSGDIGTLNTLLSDPYFITGEVESARHVGTALGYPTANIRIPDNRLPIGDGVYATILQAEGKIHTSVTNVGAKPTFGIDSESIETYILNFNGDLYGKTVRLSFITRIRDVKKFLTVDDLKSQLSRDVGFVRELLNIDMESL